MIKSYCKLFLFTSAIAGFIGCASERKDNLFESLSGIEGNWVMHTEVPGSMISESWHRENDTLFVGNSYEIVNGDSTLSESIRLTTNGSEIYYTPVVQDQNDKKPVPFKLLSHENSTYVFENPNHDFPTRITYEFKGKDSLFASVSGMVSGEMRSLEFYYVREN